MTENFEFGDLVSYDMGDGYPGQGYVAGQMSYSPHVLLLATETAVGMPINERWCLLVSRGHRAAAQTLRDRYLAKFPDALAAH